MAATKLAMAAATVGDNPKRSARTRNVRNRIAEGPQRGGTRTGTLRRQKVHGKNVSVTRTWRCTSTGKVGLNYGVS